MLPVPLNNTKTRQYLFLDIPGVVARRVQMQTCANLELIAMRQELVTNAAHSSKMCRPRRLSLEFLTQPQNMVVDGARARIVLVSPHLVKQFVAGNRSPFIANHVLQYLELHGSERDGLSVAPRFHRRKIDRCISENEGALGTCPLVLLRGFAQLPQQL